MRSPLSIATSFTNPPLLSGSAVAAVILASLAIVPAPVSAQTIESPYSFIDTRHEVALFAGITRPDQGTFGFGPGDGNVFGARYTFHISGPFSIEGVATGVSSTRDVIDPTVPEGSRVVGEADALLGALEARIKFSLTGNRTWHGISPHLLVGGGGIFDLKGEDEADLALPLDQRFSFDGSFLGSLGTGIRWLPTDRLGFRLDGLLTLWQLSAPPGYAVLEDELGTVEETEWVQAPSLTFGAAFRF